MTTIKRPFDGVWTSIVIPDKVIKGPSSRPLRDLFYWFCGQKGFSLRNLVDSNGISAADFLHNNAIA